MSFIEHVVVNVDQQFDRLHANAQEATRQDLRRDDGTLTDIEDQHMSSNLSNLHNAIQQLTVSSQSRATLKRTNLRAFLGRIRLVPRDKSDPAVARPFSEDGQRQIFGTLSEQERLEWVVLGKVTTRAYGLVLDSLLREIVPLEDEINYWRETIASSRYTSLYSLQTSPWRLWDWTRGIWTDVRVQQPSLHEAWRSFYQRIRLALHHRSMHDAHSSISMPVALLRRDLQKKQERLERLKRQCASSIGFLLAQGLEIAKVQSHAVTSLDDGLKETKTTVSRYLSVIDASLTAASHHNESASGLSTFSLQNADDGNVAEDIYVRLQSILQQRLPEQSALIQTAKAQDGRPSRLVRYWIPVAAFLLSSTTILRIVLSRKNDIVTWLRNVGDTVLDFYLNWVVEPGRRLVGTIRHDEDSEVSIMSKRSLEGDRNSLERMVVDFAVQHPEGASLSPQDIASVQAKVREGDLTPVLKAYERDMQSPLWRSVRGTLIRALLIQIQKTKVDVEVAMGGIDALLKSQELVFGFISLTPGLLVLIGTYRWLTNLFSSRRSLRRGEIQKQSARIFRNLDRILVDSDVDGEHMRMEYELFGLLVCEAVVLRDLAAKVLPKQIFDDFNEDFDSLIDLQSGVKRQLRVVDRIRWTYSRWLL